MFQFQTCEVWATLSLKSSWTRKSTPPLGPSWSTPSSPKIRNIKPPTTPPNMPPPASTMTVLKPKKGLIPPLQLSPTKSSAVESAAETPPADSASSSKVSHKGQHFHFKRNGRGGHLSTTWGMSYPNKRKKKIRHATIQERTSAGWTRWSESSRIRSCLIS